MITPLFDPDKHPWHDNCLTRDVFRQRRDVRAKLRELQATGRDNDSPEVIAEVHEIDRRMWSRDHRACTATVCVAE